MERNMPGDRDADNFYRKEPPKIAAFSEFDASTWGGGHRAFDDFALE
jgi:hypothetical protein